jgi:putative copper export protein
MRSRTLFLVLLAGVVLTALSFAVIGMAARDEPYFRFAAKDALVQVGGGSALLALWAVYLVYCVYLAATERRLRRLTTLVVLWGTLICGVYLWGCPIGYVQDIAANQGSGTYSTAP